MTYLLLLFVLTTSTLANVVTIGPGVEKDGKKYFLQFPDCRTAFYAGDNFVVESANLKIDWNSRYEQSKKFLTPALRGFVVIKDETEIIQTDLSGEISQLQLGEVSSNRKIYDKCIKTPEIKLLSSEKMEVEMIKDEYGSVKLITTPGKIFMTIDLNPLIPEHRQFLHKLFKQQNSKIHLKLSALQEIASCRLESSYEFMARFSDVIYYDRVCRDTKVCKKYWFVTECWKEYKCHHIPHTKRVFVEALLKDSTMLELSTRPGSEATIRDYLIDQCLDGFIVSNFMSKKIEEYANGSVVEMDTLLKEHKNKYSFQTSVIEAYPNIMSLPLKMQDEVRTQLAKTYPDNQFDCFQKEESIWLPENHYCIKEILK